MFAGTGTSGGIGMQERTELLRMINQERKMLDAVVEQGLDHEGVYEQSKKLDALIEKYYVEN